MSEKNLGPGPKAKVFWSDLERVRIVKRAADLMQEQPGLEGLPLLKASLDVLPPERHRDLIALSQASWFRRMVGEEMKRREMESQLKDETVAVLKQHRGHHVEWMEAQFARYDEMIRMLGLSVQKAEEQKGVTQGWHVWEESVLEFNKVATALLAQTAAVTKAHAERTEEWEKLRQETSDLILADHKKMVELLGRICGELHDLNVRLAAPAGPTPPS